MSLSAAEITRFKDDPGIFIIDIISREFYF